MELKTLFPTPDGSRQAERQARIVDRALSLFTEDGYDWYIAVRNPYLFGICGQEGQHYAVNMEGNTCNCKGFISDGDCKHRIAVSISQECYNASLVKRYELTQPAELLAA